MPTLRLAPWRHLIALVFLLTAQSALALADRLSVKDYHHTVWTAKVGAPKDTWSIAQTADGWIWFGGTAGLSRFDGARFERIDQTVAGTQRSEAVSSLFALPSGALLIGRLTGGVSMLENGRMIHFDSPDTQHAGAVIAFAQGADGTLWAASQAGLLQLVEGSWRRATSTGLPDGHVSAIVADGLSTLWVATRHHVYRQTQGRSEFESLDRQFSNITDFVTAPDGRLWAADDDGVHLLPGQSVHAGRAAQANSRMSYTALFDREGVLWNVIGGKPSTSLRSVTDLVSLGATKTMMEDRDGNLWIGDSDAVIHRIRRPVLRRAAGAPRHGNATPWVGMAVDNSGKVWMATAYSGNTAVPEVDGLWVLDGAFQRVEPGRIRSATAIAQNAQNFLVVGGRDGLWRRDGKRWVLAAPLPAGTERQFVGAVSAEANGALWVALEGAGLFRHDGRGWQRNGEVQGLPQAPPTVMLHDSQDRLWLGYADGSVIRAEGGKAHFLVSGTRLQTGAVRAISVGRHIVFGGDHGIGVLRDGHATALRPSLAGVFDNVSGLVETDDGDLWVHGHRGLVHVAAAELDRGIDSPASVVTALFDEEDGHPGTTRHAIGVNPTLAQTGDGKLWIAAQGGIAWIDPKHLRRTELAPPVMLKTLDSHGTKTQLAHRQEVRLTQGTRNLQIDYTALNFSHPDRLRFRYRLEGVERDWVQAETRREAFYSNLGPGTYRFVVNVTDERGVWSDAGAALQIDIPPTFVQSRGFLVMCMTAGLLLLWLLHRLRVRQLTARERARMADLLRERERIARELHDTLLQSTQALMLRFGAAARSMSLHPAADGILRATLQSAEDVIAEGRDRIHNLRAVPLAGGDLGQALSELGRELAGQYGTQFASHTHGRLLALPAVTEDALFRIGREALLNAFAHAGAHRIDLTLSAVQDTLHLKVSDDGVGLPPEVQRDGFAPGHWGLQGMREQTERLLGKLQISGRPDGGTQVDVSVPLLARGAAPWAARLMHLVSRRRHRSDD